MTRIQKLSILSISLLSIMSSATITPVLPDIGEYFSSASELAVKMVVSLPGIFIIPVALLCGTLIHHVKKKHLLYVGLSLYIIGGLGGALANSIVLLLVLRSIMGIGVGFLIPLARSLIADLFDGDERNKMMGYSTSFNNLGGIIATVAAGTLTVYGWRYPFLVYVIGIIVFIIVALYLPDQEIQARETEKAHINKNVWLLGFSHFMMIQIFFAIPTDLGFFITSEGYGEGFVIGLLISLVTLGSFIIGLLFHKLKNTFKGMTVTIGIFLISIGMLLIGVSSNVVHIAIALLLVGFGLGIVASNIYLQTSLDSSPHDVTLSLAVVSAASFLGQFTAPLVMEFLQTIFHYNTSTSPFILSSIIGGFTIVGVLINKKIHIYKPHHN